MGIVTDSGGSPVNGATVTITDTTEAQGSAVATTDANGKYQLNIRSYSSDGDNIQTIVTSGLYSETLTYTLDVSHMAKRFDVTLDEAFHTASDDANTSDSIAQHPSIVVGDDANASDGIVFDGSIVVSDDANASDNLVFSVSIVLSDDANASDGLILDVDAVLADDANASDGIIFSVSIVLSDDANAVDIIFPDQLTLTDVAHANDSVSYSYIVPETPFYSDSSSEQEYDSKDSHEEEYTSDKSKENEYNFKRKVD
jgi:hypothetical protein